MKVIEKNKGVILFYLVAIVCTFMMIERVKELNNLNDIGNKELVYAK